MKHVISFAALCLCFSGQVFAQAYPNKPVRLIAPYAVGGPADIRGRIFAQALSAQLGQPVLVDNQGGGGGVVGANMAAKAPKDGYTAILFNATVLATAAMTAHDLPYDPDRDFEAVALVANSPEVLVVDAKLGINNVSELVARAKASPGKMNFGSAGASSLTRLAMELFKVEAGVDIVHVPYKGMAPAVADMLASRVQVAIADISVLQASINSGAFKALAVTSARRIPLAPNVPTTAEAGLPRVISDNMTTLMMTGGSPQSAVLRMRDAAMAALKLPDTVQQFAKQGIIAAPGGPDEVRRVVREERARWEPIIKANNIKAE
jgi:tripartite-type tricarboxylate transporter receptor subunit TctC